MKPVADYYHYPPNINDLSFVSRFIKSQELEWGSVVDIGCGAGRYTEQIVDCNPLKYTGYDPSMQYIHQAQLNFPNDSRIEFVCVDILNFASDETYDVAFCLDVINIFDKPLLVLDKLVKLWKAKRYVVSVLFASRRKLTRTDVVIGMDDLIKLAYTYCVLNTSVMEYHDHISDGEVCAKALVCLEELHVGC